MLDEQTSKHIFEEIMRVWIYPEIDRRTKNKIISDKFLLDKAQVLLNPNNATADIRLNDEVKAEAIGRLKPGIQKKYLEPVYEDELQDEILKIRLTDKDDPNSAHVTMLRFKGKWVIHFDFRYNKAEAKKRYEAAREFYEVAEISYHSKYWRPFVDNLFSSAELFVTSQLLVLSLIKRMTHNSIQIQYNSFIDIGNYKVEHKQIFNKLRGLRDAGRYFNQQFTIDYNDGKDMLLTVKNLGDYTKQAIT
jgi:hypothetical protein